MSDEKNNSSDPMLNLILLLGAAGFLLTTVGLIGLIWLACEFLYESYGPVPSLGVTVVAGMLTILQARMMLKRYAKTSSAEASAP